MAVGSSVEKRASRESGSAAADLVIQGLRLEYRQPGQANGLVAVDDFNLEVKPGEFISILGPSGCGKSTTLMMVAGLLRPTDGDIRVNDQLVSGVGRERSLVFQEAALLPWRTVARNVALGFEFRKDVPKREQKEVVEHYIDLVGLRGFSEHYPHQLSGGMRQRVGIARALAANPQLLLMDEPFGALDAQTRDLMGTELLRIWSTEQKTVIFVTHSIDEAIFLSDRVIVMTARPGRIKDIVDVQLPRPRDFSIRSSPEFLAYRDHAWAILEEEVNRSLQK